jgi:hypothetical protein
MRKSIPYVCAALAFGRAISGWVFFHARVTPDFETYTHGGLWWYPSPIGRLLGWSLGEDGFATLNAVSCGAMILLVARIARKNNSSETIASFAMLLLPVSWVIAYAGIDAFAVCLFLGAILASGRNRFILATLSVASHFQLLPFVLFIPEWTITAVFFAFVGGIAITIGGALSPYSPLFARIIHPESAITALLESLAIFSVQVALFWPWIQQRAKIAGLVMVASAECGLEHHVQTRYGLLIFVLASSMLIPRYSRVASGLGWKLNGYAGSGAS